MVDMVYYLTNLLFFDILLSYYCINLRSSIIFCLFSGDIHLSLCISLSCSFITVSELIWFKFFQTFEILSTMSLPLKSRVASTVFLIYSFRHSFRYICCRLFSMIKKFLAISTAYAFTYIFTKSYGHIFSKRQKFIAFYKYSSPKLNGISQHL